MILALVVGLTAGAGAVARYVVDQVVQGRYGSRFPYGTLVVNISGSLLLGLVTGTVSSHGLGHGPAVVLSAGFCSGYTTWSTFSYDTLALAETGAVLQAAWNVALSLTTGLAAAAAGLALARL